MKQFLVVILAFFSIGVGTSYAQIQSGGFSPLPFTYSNEQNTIVGKRNTQPLFYKIPYNGEQDNKEEKTSRFVVGKSFAVDYSPLNAGQQFTTEDGTTIWRIGFYSPNAASISVVFDEFEIPEGASIFVYNPSQTNVAGAFTSINNNSNKSLPIAPFPSDSIIIEYQQPATVTFNGKLRIGRVTHNTIDFINRSTGSFNSAEKCSPHAAFVEGVSNIKQATCLLYVTDNSESWLGSGVMINNSEGKPYLLTAAHNYEGTNLEQTTIFYFNYEVPKVDSLIRGSQEFTLGGSVLKAKAYDIDFALVELNQMPPADYRPYLAGWNRANSDLAPMVCVQHPQGDVKRVSTDNDNPLAVTYPYNDLLETKLADAHWKITRWEKGTTEPGSSGSGLFDNNYRIIGGLTGGNSTCNSPVEDYFFRLNKAWSYYSSESKQLKRWLDPTNTNVMYMDGRNPYEATPCIRYSNVQSADVMGKVSVGNGKTGRLSGHNELQYTEFAEKFVTDTNNYLYGVYIVPFIGKYNVNTPVNVHVYNGTSSPETLLTTVLFNPKTLAYQATSQTFAQTTKTQFLNRENYVRFPNPVLVDEEFFVSYSITYQPVDSFAVYMVNNRAIDALNTAYYKDNGIWKSFTEHPYKPMASSLWIEPVFQEANESLIFYPHDEDANAILFPNPCDSEIQVFRKETNTAQFSLFSIQGTLLFTISSIENPLTINTSGLQQGIYFLQITRDDTSNTYKLIKK